MTKDEVWFLERLKSKPLLFGDEILEVNDCTSNYLITTFIKGLFEHSDGYVLYYFGYLKDIGDGWSGPVFVSNNKQCTLMLNQCMELYKYLAFRWNMTIGHSRYELSELDNWTVLSYIDFNVPLQEWFQFVSYNAKLHLKSLGHTL